MGRIAVNPRLNYKDTCDMYVVNSYSKTVYDSLVLNYDFSNPACYPGSGNQVADLKSGIIGTIAGDITYTAEGDFLFGPLKGAIRIVMPTQAFLTTNDYTFVAFTKPDAIANPTKRMVVFGGVGYDQSSTNSFFEYGHWYDQLFTRVYQSGISFGVQNLVIENSYKMMSAISTPENTEIYENENLIINNTDIIDRSGIGEIILGARDRNGVNLPFFGRYGGFLLFDRRLTSAEISKVYNDNILKY